MPASLLQVPRFNPDSGGTTAPLFPPLGDGWRRLSLLAADFTNNPNALIVGGMVAGVTETSATSQVSVVTVAVDRSRATAAAVWGFNIRTNTGDLVTTARPLFAEFLIEIVSEGAANQGLCVTAGLTNSTTFAGQHTENGMHDDATGRRLRAGSQASVVDQTAAVGLVFAHDDNVFTQGAESHCVGHALDASGVRIAANGKVGQNTILGMTGTLSAYVAIGRSIGDGNTYTFGVRAYMRSPILQPASFVP